MPIESLESRLLLSTYWVDATIGNDSFAGTAANPLKTIAKAVSFTHAGDTVEVDTGVYRDDKISFPNSGTAGSPITLTAAPNASVQIKSASVVTGWTPAGGVGPIYTHSNWTFYSGTWDPAFTSTPQGNIASLDARNEARNQLFVDGHYVQEVPRPVDLAPGTFYVDKTAHVISLWLADGSDPATHTVEVADNWTPLLNTNGKSYLVISGLHFFYGANAPQGSAMVQINGGSYVTFEDSSVQYAAGAGIGLEGGAHITVLRSVFNNNGQEGIHSDALTNSLVQGCECSYNDQLAGKQYSPGWEAGGNKFAQSTGVTVSGMLAHDNWGAGIWFDVNNQNATITGCTSYNNRFGIEYEISYAATITNNLVYNCTLQGNSNSSPNGIGIYVSSSEGCGVYNNTVYNCDTYGIEVNTTVRTDGNGYDISGVSNDFRNNIVAQNQTAYWNDKSYAIGTFDDGTHPALPALNNPNPNFTETYNTSDYNLFWLSTGLPFFIGTGSNRPATLSVWQQNSAQDAHSVFADPRFVNAAANNFQLAPGSPGRGIGTALALVPSDHDGRIRYAGLVDMGALQVTTRSPASVAGRYVFYAGSAFDNSQAAPNAADDNAIAPDKAALLPGQTATFANYTSYSNGINGVIVDVQYLANGAALSAGDFQFRVGNSSDPTTWAIAPAPTTVLDRPAAGASQSDRVELIWANGAIRQEWLQLTVLADANTGLLTPDVFYFGNAIGDSGNSPTDAAVNSSDALGARGHRSAGVSITNAWDYNRDGVVDATDVAIAQQNATAGNAVLPLFAAPSLITGASRFAASQAVSTTTNATPVTAVQRAASTTGGLQRQTSKRRVQFAVVPFPKVETRKRSLATKRSLQVDPSRQPENASIG